MTVAGTSARLWVLGVGLLVTLVALPGIGVRATYGAQLTADEPHYLLTTISLAEDGDLDVSDETADERYRPFHEVRLPPQAAPRADGTAIVPHDPLLPAVLTGPWMVGGWRGAKAAIAVMLGLAAALTTWIAIRRRGVRPSVAGPVTAVLFASAPLAVYGTQVYPEVPAALAVLAATAAILGRPSRATAATVVISLVVLPWLSVKYVPVTSVVAAVWAWRWWREGAARLVTGGAVALVTAGITYVLAHVAWYGGLTVYAAGDFFQEHGGELTVVGLAPDYLGRARRLVGLILGRDFGLMVWQPAWALLPAAALAAVRRRRDGVEVLLAPLAAGWLTATFVALTMQGWWFPGRQLVVVLPLAAILIAELADAVPVARVLTFVLGLLGTVTLAWLFADGLAQRLTLVVDFARVGDPLFLARRAVLPDYLRVTGRTWSLQTVWIVGLVSLAVALSGWRPTWYRKRS